MSTFKIPLQTEVSLYIHEKKGWPKQFCDYYAERFWHHYNSRDWTHSRGIKIKDWKSCFIANWQTLKFKEDIEMFEKCSQAKVIPINGTVVTSPIELLDQLLTRYYKNPSSTTIEKLAGWSGLDTAYSAIKENQLWDPTLTGKDLTVYGDKNMVKALVILRTFTYYSNQGWTFSGFIQNRNKKKRRG